MPIIQRWPLAGLVLLVCALAVAGCGAQQAPPVQDRTATIASTAVAGEPKQPAVVLPTATIAGYEIEMATHVNLERGRIYFLREGLDLYWVDSLNTFERTLAVTTTAELMEWGPEWALFFMRDTRQYSYAQTLMLEKVEATSTTGMIVADPGTETVTLRSVPMIGDNQIGSIAVGEMITILGRKNYTATNYWLEIRREDGSEGCVFGPLVDNTR